MKLYYQSYLEQHPLDGDKTPIIIIPGLFGSTGNWRGFAKKLSQHWPVIVVDQRNHGQSPHADQNSYYDLVDDLLELLEDLNLSKISLCGHSMGGKTAMLFALTQAQRLDQLMVLDIAPVTYTHSHAPILEALKRVDLTCAASRSEVEQQLVASIPDKSTRLFIMLSLVGRAREFEWRLNIDALYNNLGLIGGFPAENDTNRRFDTDCLFIKGADSDYVNDNCENIKSLFPRAELQTVENAGHWLHIEQQNAVIEQILNFLQKRAKK